MEENEDLDDVNFSDNLSEQKKLYLFRKLFHSVLVFNSHLADYINQNDPELFKRAIDYAKTFTEEDVPGIVMKYIDKEKHDGKN